MKQERSFSKIYALIFIAFIFLFFKGAMEEYLHIPGNYLDLIEGLMFVLMGVVIVFQSTLVVPGIIIISLFLLWNMFSTIYNNYSFLDWLYYSRHLVGSFLFFNLVYISKLSKPQIIKIIKLLGIIFIIQVIVASFELLIYGKPTEYRVGTMFYGAGGYATVFPLVAMSYGLGLFYFYRRKWYVFLLVLSFVVVGCASGKRAIFFFVPVILLFAQFIYVLLVDSFKHALKSITFYTIISLPLLFALLFLLGHTKRFGELSEIEGLVDKAEYIYYVAEEYSFRTGSSGQISGRGSNTTHFISLIANGEYEEFWLGGGPMSCSKKYSSMMLEKYYFGYGITGWIYNALSTGIPASILIFIFFLNPTLIMYRLCDFKQLSSLGKSIYLGNILFLFSFCMVYMFYTTCFAVTSIYSIVYLFFSALLISPHYRQIFSIEAETDADSNSKK